MNRLRQRTSPDHGFTLVELLVVVIVIGILAAIAIPTFLNQRAKGVEASVKSDLRNAATSVETWMADHPRSVVVESVTPATHTQGATPDGGTTGVADRVEDTALAGVKASPGNELTLTAHPDGETGAFCVFGFNPNASTAVDAESAMVYDSTAGGLVKASGSSDCEVPGAPSLPGSSWDAGTGPYPCPQVTAVAMRSGGHWTGGINYYWNVANDSPTYNQAIIVNGSVVDGVRETSTAPDGTVYNWRSNTTTSHVYNDLRTLTFRAQTGGWLFGYTISEGCTQTVELATPPAADSWAYAS